MNGYVGYIRVSTQKQGEGVSLIEQRSAIEVFAAQHGLKVVRWYEEQVTAAKQGRPAFNAMLKDLKRRKALGVIFHKIDRSSRNFGDWGRLGELHEAGLDIRFASDGLDFNSRGGRLAADVQMVVAADYIRNLREESIKGLTGRLKQGIYPFKAPLGYTDQGKGKPKAIDPVRAPLIRKLFELYASGSFSLHSIVPEMERRGLTSAKGKPLPKTSIEKILKNPFYAGVMTVGSFQQSFLGQHKAIVPVHLFQEVAVLRGERDNRKSTKHNHRYRGLIKCSHCGRSVVPELQKGKVYYRCRSKGCRFPCLREDEIERRVRGHLKTIGLMPAQTDEIRRELHAWHLNGEQARMAKHAEQMLTKVNERLSSLTDKFLDDLIDQEIYQMKNKQLLLEKKKWSDLAREKAHLDVQAKKLDQIIDRFTSACSAYELAAPPQKREIVKITCANLSYDGKYLAIEPSNTAVALSNLSKTTYCDPSSARTRTFEDMSADIEALLSTPLIISEDEF